MLGSFRKSLQAISKWSGQSCNETETRHWADEPSIFCVEQTNPFFFFANLARASCPAFGFACNARRLLSIMYFHTSPGFASKASMLERCAALWPRHKAPGPRKVGIPDAAERPAPHRARIRLDLYRCLPKELISSSVAKEYCGSDTEEDILLKGLH
jgi:hypothetical protein